MGETEVHIDIGGIRQAQAGLTDVINQLNTALGTFDRQKVPTAAFGQLGSSFAAQAEVVHENAVAAVKQIEQFQTTFSNDMTSVVASLSNMDGSDAAGLNRLQAERPTMRRA